MLISLEAFLDTFIEMFIYLAFGAVCVGCGICGYNKDVVYGLFYVVSFVCILNNILFVVNKKKLSNKISNK